MSTGKFRLQCVLQCLFKVFTYLYSLKPKQPVEVRFTLPTGNAKHLGLSETGEHPVPEKEYPLEPSLIGFQLSFKERQEFQRQKD